MGGQEAFEHQYHLCPAVGPFVHRLWPDEDLLLQADGDHRRQVEVDHHRDVAIVQIMAGRGTGMTETGRILAHGLPATVGQDHTRPGRDRGLRHDDNELPLNLVAVIEVAIVVVCLATIVAAIVHPGVKGHGEVLATVVTAVGHGVAVRAEIGVVIGGGSR